MQFHEKMFWIYLISRVFLPGLFFKFLARCANITPINYLFSFLDNITDSKRLINLAFGIDDTQVKMSGKPLSIGLEDRFKCISSKSECLEKVDVLIQRLTKLVLEDGRKPTTLKVFIRDYEKDKHDPARKFCKQSRCVG